MIQSDNQSQHKQSFAQSVISKSFWLYFFTVIIAPTSYIMKVVISNSVSTTDLWVLYGIIWLITLMSIYNDFGLTESLKYFLPRYQTEKKQWKSTRLIYRAWAIQSITSVALWVLARYVAPRLAEHYFQSEQATGIIRLFAFFFFGVNIFQVINTVLLALHDTFFHKIMEVARYWSATIIILLIFFVGRESIETYAYAWIIGVGVGVAVWVLLAVTKYKKLFLGERTPITVMEKNKIWNYSLWAYLWLNAGTLMSYIDLQMIIWFLGPESAWYYTNYTTLLNTRNLVITPIFGFLMTITSQLVAQKNRKKLHLLKEILINYFTIFAISFGGFIALWWPHIAVILFGQQFLYSGQLLQLGAAFLLFPIITTICMQFLAGQWSMKRRVLIILIATTINIILNILLIPVLKERWGIIATIIARWCMYLLSLHALQKISQQNNQKKLIRQWRFLLTNSLFLICLRTGMYLLSGSLVYGETLSERIIWFGILASIGVGYYWLLLLFNKDKLLLLRQQLRTTNTSS